MMTVESSVPVEVELDEPVAGNSNDVVPTTQDSEAVEAEWLNEHCLAYQKGEKHATNSPKKGQEKDMVAGPEPPLTTISMLISM